MDSFNSDDYGHRSNRNDADLGYGWIHYGLIRLIKPTRLLCIGSRYGYIPAVMAQACKDNDKGVVDFVDPGYGESDKNHWTGVGYWKVKEGRECFNKFGLRKWISTYLLTSEEFKKKYNKREYGYIYIDGNHSYDGVTNDYKLFFPKLKIGGFMVFHDICVKGAKTGGIYGVGKLWEELLVKDSHISFVFSGSGLGVIQKNRQFDNQ